jgi:nucleotide-binding universal stress UspA family protein
MYRKILIAYNGTPESRLALEECKRLAPGPSAEIHLLAVITPVPIVLAGEFAAALPTAADEAAERNAMEQVLESGRTCLAEAGLSVITHLDVGEAVDIVADMVSRYGIELVIVGHSRQKPFALRWWRGSTDSILVERVRCSVLVATDPPRAAAA